MDSVIEYLKKRFGDQCAESVKSVLGDIKVEKPNEHLINSVIKLKNIFSNATRVSIIFLLAQHPLPVCALASILDKDQTLISHNLAALKRMGIVEEKREKKFRIYFLRKQKLIELLEVIIKDIMKNNSVSG